MVTGFQMSIPPDQDSDDPWTLLSGSAAVASPEPEQPALQIETIEGIEPLDTQIGVFPKKTVPDALHDALFGQPEPRATEIEAAGGDPAAIPPMQTYAILDAAKVTNLPEILERSGLEHRCLFKGNAYDELKNVAPWIVRLEEDNAFTRNLFTRGDAHWCMWDQEPGIYVRARGTLDDMWKHFRKFTRIQDEDGKWFYFRFWEATLYISSTENRPPLFPFPPSFFKSLGERKVEFHALSVKGQHVRISSLNNYSAPLAKLSRKALHAWYCMDRIRYILDGYKIKYRKASLKYTQMILGRQII